MPIVGTLRRGWGRTVETVRPKQEKTKKTALRLAASFARLLSGCTILWPQHALAAFIQTPSENSGGSWFNHAVGSSDVIQLAIFIGAMGAAMFSAAWLIRERAKIAAENIDLRAGLSQANTQLARYGAYLDLTDQRVIFWPKDSRKPEIAGNLPREAGAPEERATFLAFGRWLDPSSAARLDRELAKLRESGKPFDLVVQTNAGKMLDAHGRSSAAGILVRFVSLFEQQQALAVTRIENDRMRLALDSLKGLMEILPNPVWMRNHHGALSWVNSAYAQSVDARDADAAVAEQRELLATRTREKIELAHSAGNSFTEETTTVVAGDRRVLNVTDAGGADGSAGIATDVSENEHIRDELKRIIKNHSDTLDQLTTAVVIFDRDQKLRFYNQAFQKLWDLEAGFLDSAPDNNLVLDRLRSEGKLEEHPEWRKWKNEVLDAYRALEASEDWWHLPDGRSIRVVSNPHPNGGVTWVFENMTKQIDLESRYNTAVRVQGETLDNLAEGVVVFGSDGRVRLTNPAFEKLWGLQSGKGAPNTHISEIAAACGALTDESPWPKIVSSVTGFDDARTEYSGKVQLVTGTILSFAVVPLPNGQVMTTFDDVTDTVNVERALTEKNEALQRADTIKNEFLHHVSYELRSPLTNIIGFTELLLMPDTGPLNDRQTEYINHIGSSSSVLLNTVNDILDLATVDAGIMELEIDEVRIGDAVEFAREHCADRLQEHSIELSIDIGENVEPFMADDHRVRQILTNLLSNAANFAPENSTVSLTCSREEDFVVFTVHDDGPGMPQDVLDSVFKRFEPHRNGGRQSGPGLGLAIVKSFVELHGGTVEIDTGVGNGTTVVCRFPDTPKPFRAAAE